MPRPHFDPPPMPAVGTPERSVLDELLAAWSGAESACERAYLSRRTGLTDRSVRLAVEALRALEWPIMASSGQAGYWLTLDTTEIDRFIDREISPRIEKLARTRAGMVNARRRIRAVHDAKVAPVQVPLFDAPLAQPALGNGRW